MGIPVWFGLLAVVLHSTSSHLLSPPYNSWARWIALGCYAIAAIGLLAVIMDKGNVNVYSLSEAVIRIRNPHIVEMEKIKDMSEQQIILYFGGEGIEHDFDLDSMTETFTALGRTFRAVDLKRYIEKSEAHHPNCMSLSRHGNGTAEQMDERAYLYVLKYFKLVRSRDGLTYKWNKSIDEVLDQFQFSEVTQ